MNLTATKEDFSMTIEEVIAHARHNVARCKRSSLLKAAVTVEHLEALLDALEGPNTPDPVGERVRSELSKSELKLARLFACEPVKNSELARQMGKTEQVVKNYLRQIFDKTGMGDRMELYAFLQNHPVILEESMESAA